MRYSIFPLTGWRINPQATEPGNRKPSTTWYVWDSAQACVVARYLSKHMAHLDAVRSNLRDRKWDEKIAASRAKHGEDCRCQRCLPLPALEQA